MSTCEQRANELTSCSESPCPPVFLVRESPVPNPPLSVRPSAPQAPTATLGKDSVPGPLLPQSFQVVMWHLWQTKASDHPDRGDTTVSEIVLLELPDRLQCEAAAPEVTTQTRHPSPPAPAFALQARKGVSWERRAQPDPITAAQRGSSGWAARSRASSSLHEGLRASPVRCSMSRFTHL